MAVSQKRRAKAAAKSEPNTGSGWRSFLVGALVALTGLGIALLAMVVWVERQLLTTENWVSYASSLPKDPVVSDGLSMYIADKLFEEADVQSRVEEALPPRAGFLAAPLTDQLETLTRGAAERVVESDSFESLWVSVNRAAHQRLMERARSDQPQIGGNERLDIDLSGAVPLLRERLGRVAEALPERTERDLSVAADLQTRRERFARIVQSVDFLRDVLPYVCLAVGLGALALARDRRRVLLAGSVLVVVLSLLQLIAVNAVRTSLLDRVQNAQYEPAVGAIYDSLLGGFSSMVYAVLAIAALVWFVMYLTGPSDLGGRLRRFVRMNEIQETRPYAQWRWLRLWMADQKYYLWAVLGIITLFYLSFTMQIDWQVAVNSLLVLLSGIALVQIMGSPDYLIEAKR